MSAKKIYPKEMFETPEVNILNDNVLTSVDYSYNKSYPKLEELSTNNNFMTYTGKASNITDKIVFEIPKFNDLYTQTRKSYVISETNSYGIRYATFTKTVDNLSLLLEQEPINVSHLSSKLNITGRTMTTVDLNVVEPEQSNVEDDLLWGLDVSQITINVSSKEEFDSYLLTYDNEISNNLSSYINRALKTIVAINTTKLKENIIELYFRVPYWITHYKEYADSYNQGRFFEGSYITTMSSTIGYYKLAVEPINIETNSQLVLQGNELIQEGTHFPPIPEVTDYDPHFPTQYFSLGTGYANDYLYLYFNSNTLDNSTEKPYDLWGGLTISAKAKSLEYGDYNIETSIGILGEDDSKPYRDEYVRMYIERDPENANGLIFNCEVFETTTSITFSLLKLEYTYYTKMVITPEQKQLWKDVVPQKIANEYKNGKSTIRLTAVYDGTNEYAVGDLVIPMKSDTEPILKNADGAAKQFEVTSSEIVFSGRSVQNLELAEYVEVK